MEKRDHVVQSLHLVYITDHGETSYGGISWLKRRRRSCCAPGSRDSQGRPSPNPKTLELKANGDPVGLSADVGIVVLLEDGEVVGLSADVGIVVLPVQNSLKLTFKLVTILSQA
ncbi:hypothetical protein IGI04_002846 [Brassica rapa subsp. trilocularis]|uniref:Uncharacterized protein n=1 Tax=Brassica rapa subsp. trilocularis TaxID=1813537 RepID=A0ABQ7NWP5_BRACM|nr:hypothetical protein IGI04_002846 [Brassica rapa subsp. trilocularis]